MEEIIKTVITILVSGLVGWFSNNWKNKRQKKVETAEAKKVEIDTAYDAWQKITNALRQQITILIEENQKLNSKIEAANEKLERLEIEIEKMREQNREVYYFKNKAEEYEKILKKHNINFSMKSLLLLLFCGLTCFVFLSCKSPIKTVEKTKTITITETIRDTVVTIEPDMSLLQALIECDSLGKAHIKQLFDCKFGSRLKPPKVQITDNILTAVSEVDSMSIYLKLKETTRETEKNNVINLVKYIYENRLTRWQQIRIWIANILMVILPVYGVFLIRKIMKF